MRSSFALRANLARSFVIVKKQEFDIIKFRYVMLCNILLYNAVAKMIYNIQAKGFNEDFEEEILIQINNIKIKCFVHTWGTNVEIDKFYDADIRAWLLDDLKMEARNNQEFGFEQIDDSYAYRVCGKFDYDSRTIDAGVIIQFDENEVDLFDFAYLDGKFVCAKIDRIVLLMFRTPTIPN